jgi:hypothetical protein
VEKKMSDMSTELATIKTMITEVLQQQAQQNNIPPGGNIHSNNEITMQDADNPEEVVCTGE